jgi:hypothetical protein
MNYEKKYLKYKNKYLKLKQNGGNASYAIAHQQMQLEK